MYRNALIRDPDEEAFGLDFKSVKSDFDQDQSSGPILGLLVFYFNYNFISFLLNLVRLGLGFYFSL